MAPSGRCLPDSLLTAWLGVQLLEPNGDLPVGDNYSWRAPYPFPPSGVASQEGWVGLWTDLVALRELILPGLPWFLERAQHLFPLTVDGKFT